MEMQNSFAILQWQPALLVAHALFITVQVEEAMYYFIPQDLYAFLFFSVNFVYEYPFGLELLN